MQVFLDTRMTITTQKCGLPRFSSVGEFSSTCFLIIFLCVCGVGCGPGQDPQVTVASGRATNTVPSLGQSTIPIPAMQASPLDSTNVVRSFSARGIIREFGGKGQSVVIRHEDIPGFMPRMTMDFTVRSTNELRGFKVGDAIRFRVVANENESWIEDLKPDSTNGLPALPPPGPSTASLLHVAKLKRGDVLPDVELLGENGQTVKLSEFEGKALVFTFIFSRCPLPDYCPRMNQHFSRTRDLLSQKPDGATNWQFLSISFDAEFDQPGVLTRYAYSYRGKNTNGWFFAAAPPTTMASMVPQLDFHFLNEGGSFIHNLRTVVLDPRRRLFRQFDGNKWTAEELAEAVTQAIEAGKVP